MKTLKTLRIVAALMISSLCSQALAADHCENLDPSVFDEGEVYLCLDENGVRYLVDGRVGNYGQGWWLEAKEADQKEWTVGLREMDSPEPLKTRDACEKYLRIAPGVHQDGSTLWRCSFHKIPELPSPK